MSTIAIIGDSMPSLPTEFQRRLTAFDKDLIVVWHKSPYSKKPGRWKIEQCIQHNGVEHSHLCRRTYVMMVEDSEHTPLPLGDHVFQKLGEMRQNSESYGGQTERGLKNFLQASDGLDQKLAEKREADAVEVVRLSAKDNRLAWNRVWQLIERHDLRPNR